MPIPSFTFIFGGYSAEVENAELPDRRIFFPVCINITIKYSSYHYIEKLNG